MYTILKGTTALILVASPVLAGTSSLQGSGMGLLQNEWVTAGINNNMGTFGSGGSTSPGLLFDPTGTGTFDTNYDYLTPGTPYDGFAVKVDGTNYSNNNTGTGAITASGFVDGTDTLTWSGSVAGVFNLDNEYSLASGQKFVDVTTTIEVLTNAGTVSFSKFIDPDSQGMPGDTSATDNVLGYSSIPDTNLAFSEATQSRYALGVYTTDTNVTAGVASPWTDEADGYNGTPSDYVNDDGDNVNYGNGDDTIGISWTWGGITAGDILTANYAYIFGTSAYDAASSAQNGGAGGGNISGWAPLQDVGSAFDAAQGPTITFETVVDTSRPVLEASVTTHDSRVEGNVQTIDREMTTTTTTPMVTIEYHDGVEVNRTAAPDDVQTTTSDPGSFSARVDAADEMFEINLNHNLTTRDGFNSSYTQHQMESGDEAATTTVGLGHTFETDNGMLVALGFNRAMTTIEGDDHTGSMDTNHFGLRLNRLIDSKVVDFGIVANTASSAVNYTRTIGDFTAEGSTKKTDTSGMFRVSSKIGAFRPWAGYTVGMTKVAAYDETGDIQATLSYDAKENLYHYGTLGAEMHAGIFTAGGSIAFDEGRTATYNVGFEKEIWGTTCIGADVERIVSHGNSSTTISANLIIKF